MKTMDHERDDDFGQSMLTLRNEIGLTQEQLGNLLGVTTRTVRGWEPSGIGILGKEANSRR